MLRLAAFLFLVGLSAAHGAAQTKDFSAYDCNIFGTSMCFRVPNSVHVDYSAPVDFQLYSITNKKGVLAIIYLGGAPQKVESEKLLHEGRVKSGHFKAYGDLPDNSLDIYADMPSKAYPIIHISANLGVLGQDDLESILAGIRPCALNGKALVCEADPAWKYQVMLVMSKIKAS